MKTIVTSDPNKEFNLRLCVGRLSEFNIGMLSFWFVTGQLFFGRIMTPVVALIQYTICVVAFEIGATVVKKFVRFDHLIIKNSVAMLKNSYTGATASTDISGAVILDSVSGAVDPSEFGLELAQDASVISLVLANSSVVKYLVHNDSLRECGLLEEIPEAESEETENQM